MQVSTQETLPPGGDGELLALLRQGDGTAFAALMRRNNRRLYRIARSILRNDSEAEEAVQESYVQAFTHLDGFKGEASIATWLARIVANEALGRLRRRRPSVEIGELADTLALDGAAPEAGAASPEHAVARGEIRRLIEGAIDGLPPSFRTVFMMRAIEQMSIEETAACLGIPKDTVKTRFHRANRMLRQALSERLGSILDDAFPFAGARCDGMMRRVLVRLGFSPDRFGLGQDSAVGSTTTLPSDSTK